MINILYNKQNILINTLNIRKSSSINKNNPLNKEEVVDLIENKMLNNLPSIPLGREKQQNKLPSLWSELQKELDNFPHNISSLSEFIQKYIHINLNNGNQNIKPLGNLGDITLNEITNKILELNYTIIINNLEIILKPLTLIKAGLLYLSIIKVYTIYFDPISYINNIQDENLRNIEFNRRLVRLRNFNYIICPIIVGILLNIKYIFLSSGY
jgi:hypothetical protein